MSPPSARLKGRLGAALALGTAAAIPSVVAFSEEPRALQGSPWAPAGCDGGSGESAAARAAAGPWQLSRVLEQALESVQRLTAAQADEDGSQEQRGQALRQAGAGTGPADGEQEPPFGAAPPPTPAPAVRGTAGIADAPGGQLHVEAGQQGRQHVKWRRAHSLSPSLLAAQQPEEVRHMRQLAAAELLLVQRQARAAAHTAPLQRQALQQHNSDSSLLAKSGAEAATVEGAGLQLPPRFDGAELMRFAVAHGLLRATSPAERAAALHGAAAAAAHTAVWLEEHSFAGDEELARFAHLVHWQGTDQEGRPVLRIAIGRAVSECRGPEALAFAEAIVTHVERGVQQKLRGSCHCDCGVAPLPAPVRQPGTAAGQPSGAGRSPRSGSQPSQKRRADDDAPTSPSAAPDARPEQIVVVMDCDGASALNAARISRLFQSVAAALNQHYPGRLHELVLLDLPVVLSWMVQGIRKLVHPDTRGKLRVARHGDDAAAALHTHAPAAAAPCHMTAASPPARHAR